MQAPESLRDFLLTQFSGDAFWYIVGVYLSVTIVGYIIGFVREQHHLQTLKRRERKLSRVLLSNSKLLPASATGGHLVSANVALATDSFRILSVIYRRLFGGRVRRYERINSRAKREALIRLKEAALGLQADAIYNIRLVSSEIKSGPRRGGGTSVEVLAYGTAVRVGDKV